MENPLRYKIRSGVVDYGKDYEFQVISLLAVRYILSQTDRLLWISFNPGDVGAVDDVIIRTQHSCFMIQMKHKEDSSNIVKTELLASKGALSIKKYLDDIQLLESTICQSQTPIIQKLGDFSNIKFGIFTNRSCLDCSFLERSDCPLLLLNTKDNAVTYKINVKDYLVKYEQYQMPFCKSDTALVNLSKIVAELSARSWNDFYMISKQIHAKHIDELIVTEIDKIIAHDDIKTIAQSFIKYIKEWARGNLDGNYCLEQAYILSKLFDLLISQYKVNFSDRPYKNLKNRFSDRLLIWDRIVATCSVIVLEPDEKILEFMYKYYRKKVDEYFVGYDVSTWKYELDKNERNAFFQSAKNNFKHIMLVTVGNNGIIALTDFYKCLWLAGKVPLLVKVSTKEEYHNVLRLVELTKCAYKVVVVNGTGAPIEVPQRFNSIRHFMTLNDLNKDNIKNIVEQKIYLQGRYGSELGAILDPDQYFWITASDAIRILCSSFSVGDEFAPMPSYHIKRTLSMTFVDFEVLSKVQEIFVIQTNNRSDSRFINVKFEWIDNVDFVELKECNVLMYQNSVSEKMMELLTSKPVPVHFLRIIDGNLKLIKSLGSSYQIRLFLCSTDVTLPANKMQIFTNKTVIISASPGMGKTTLMDYLCTIAPPSDWVLRIDLNDHRNHFKKNICKVRDAAASAHLDYFFDALCNSATCRNAGLAKAVFNKLCEEKKIIVLLDGYDEVSICYKKEVVNVALALQAENYAMWMTTRPVLKNFLETELKEDASTLVSFNETNQHSFLAGYFVSMNSDLSVGMEKKLVDGFVLMLLEAAKKNLSDKDAEFTSIPLQSRLLAEYFNKDFRDYVVNKGTSTLHVSFNLLDLYDNFIQKKVDILCSKFGCGEEATRRIFMKDQAVFALNLLFSQHQKCIEGIDKYLNERYQSDPVTILSLQKDGIFMVDEEFNISCIHRTFAEYIAAKWLSETINSENEQLKSIALLLAKERSSQNYVFLFNVFDRCVAADCPLHLTIINGQYGAIHDLIDHHLDMDKCNRTFLHVLGIYGVKYPPFFKQPYNKEYNYCTTSEAMAFLHNSPNEDYLEVVVDYLRVTERDALGYSALDYALENLCLTFADSLCKHTKITNIESRLDLGLKADYLAYCTYLKLTNLLILVTSHFMARDFLIQSTELHETVADYFLHSFNSSQKYVTFFINDYIKDFKDTTQVDFIISKNIRVVSEFFAICKDQKRTSVEHDLSKVDFEGNTLLFYAIYFRRDELVDAILSKDPSVVDLKNTFDETCLHFAVKTRALKMVQKVCPLMKDLEAQNADGNTALHLALLHRCEDIIDFLICRGANVNVLNQSTKSPLHLLVENDCYELLQAYCNVRRWDMDQVDVKGNTPLLLALNNRNSRIAQLLISSKVDVDRPNKKAVTALHFAVEFNMVKVIELLLDHTEKINRKTANGVTPIYIALYNKNFDVAKMFVEKFDGEDLNGAFFEGSSTVLHCAIKFNWPADFTNLIMDRGGDLHKANGSGDRPLHLAARHSNLEMFHALLARGVDVNILNAKGESVVHVASGQALEVILKIFLENGGDIDVKDRQGNTALHVACTNDEARKATLLIGNGATINLLNGVGQHVVHCMKSSNFMEVFRGAVAAGCDLNAVDRRGNTPLHCALLNANVGVVKELLRRDVELRHVNEQKKSVLHCAVDLEEHLFFEIAAKADCVRNLQDQNSDTVLHLLLKKDSEQSALRFLRYDLDVNLQNKKKDTPLHLAVMKGFSDVIDKILKLNCSIDARNDEGTTALHLAVTKCRIGVFEKLVGAGADVAVLNGRKKTALDIAIAEKWENFVAALMVHQNEHPDAYFAIPEGDMKSKYTAAVEVLKQRVQARSKELKEGNNILHDLITNGEFDLAKLIIYSKLPGDELISRYGIKSMLEKLFSKIDIYQSNKEGNTPLHLAVMKGHKETVEALLRAESDIDLLNNERMSPNSLAYASKHNEIVFLFQMRNIELFKLLNDL